MYAPTAQPSTLSMSSSCACDIALIHVVPLEIIFFSFHGTFLGIFFDNFMMFSLYVTYKNIAYATLRQVKTSPHTVHPFDWPFEFEDFKSYQEMSLNSEDT